MVGRIGDRIMVWLAEEKTSSQSVKTMRYGEDVSDPVTSPLEEVAALNDSSLKRRLCRSGLDIVAWLA